MNLRHIAQPWKIICLLAGLLFIFSGSAKLLPISAFEFQLVRDGLSVWSVVPYLSRFLILVELVIGLNLLLLSNIKWLTVPAALFLLVFFSVYLAISIAKTGIQANCGCFGQVLPMSTLSALIKNVILICMLTYAFFRSNKSDIKLLQVFYTPAGVLVFILVFFPVHPYHQPSAPLPVNKEIVQQNNTIANMHSDIKRHDEKIAVSKTDKPKAELKQVEVPAPPRVNSVFHKFTFFSNGAVDPDEDVKIVALLSLDCDHCLQTATEIAQLQQQNKLPPILVLFLGEEKQVPDFLGSSKLRASYKILNPADFFPLLQKNPPRIILLWNGNVLGDWDQDSFSLQKLKETLLKTG